MKQRLNACLTCGACCAFFRASFYYMEADDCTPGGVPVGLTEDLTDFRRVMKGTDQKNPHCVALEGRVGYEVRCRIHPNRASVCREFDPSYYDGITPNERCDRARALYGLLPLGPEDCWIEPDDHGLRPAA